jgi:hypothetical protein
MEFSSSDEGGDEDVRWSLESGQGCGKKMTSRKGGMVGG